MDTLVEAIRNCDNPSVVGLDPTIALLPPPLLAQTRSLHADMNTIEAQASWAATVNQCFVAFNQCIIDAVKDIVPAVKVQIAMYEALGPAGMVAYVQTCKAAHDAGLYVIGDIKRGDIGSTAAAYASHLSGIPRLNNETSGTASGDESKISGVFHNDAETNYFPWYEDSVTVNPYLGSDGIIPFTEAAKLSDKDIFVLIRTSNPSSDEFQELITSEGTRVYECVADKVVQWGADSVGASEYSRVGAVVGATHPSIGAALRARMPHTLFLIPGYGAQGGTASDVAAMFDVRGEGAIVNSSRGIIGAWRHDPSYDVGLSSDDCLHIVARNARKAALDMRDSLRTALKERS